MLDKKNKLIGITYATYDSVDSQNLNYAISIKYLDKMFSALEENEIIKITDTNYTKYMGSLSQFNDNNTFLKEKYYTVNSFNTLYNITDEQNRFEYLLKKQNSFWYDIYSSMTESEKEETILLFKEINHLNFEGNANIPTDIQYWATVEFFINLNILTKYEYAIAVVDLMNYSSQDYMINHINDDYNLSAAEKTLIAYLIGKHDWYDINTNNKEDVFVYFDKKYGVEDLGAILEMLGYEVVYKENGGLTAYW